MKYGIFTRPKEEGAVLGDAYAVHEEEEFVLLGLIDGLGSGQAAAKAAQAAVACIQENRFLPLLDILKECHFVLRNTRGVVIGLLRIDRVANQVRYVGVGNVGIRALAREPFHPISYNGIVGYRLPRVHEFVGLYHPGDIFVLYSDGIDARFYSDEALLHSEQDPQRLAEAIARRYGKKDDVCVLVAR